MGLISDLLSRKESISRGRELALQFSKRLPRNKVGDEKRVNTEYELLKADAVAYQRRSNLGFLGKSQLVNSFQWTLINEGYPQEFAKELGGQLAITLAATR